eukprot:TRINITY_DN3866_c0_g1_i1.p1 TRINITY_DN3866_c0_g1~~TRINITY_DN3866_c0_g1_i1.p1  ORF type:complete len:850 (+),score=360.48 TRINITY_DN3866_c0_g1_i1:85-2550(+)
MPPKKLKQAKAAPGKAKTKRADDAADDAGKDGGKVELKDGLIQDVRGAGGEKSMWFVNNTRDKQFIVAFTFTGPAKGGPGVKQDGEKFELSIHPGEELLLASGNWTKFAKKKCASGPPDPKWVEKQGAAAAGKVDEAVAKVKAALKKRGVSKVTAEATAAACQEEGIEFVDVTFMPRDSSFKQPWMTQKIKIYPWRRPSDYLAELGLRAELFVGKIEPNDIDQGALADCYLMGALASVAEFEHLVRSLFENGHDPDMGLYRVSLCKNGWWQTVVLDDFFPMSGPKPAFARNRDEVNEIWVTLVEKAYAKVHGSFAAIMSGGAAPALGDLTGCPYKTFEFGEEAISFDELLENDMNDFLQVLGTPGKNIMGQEDTAPPDQRALWEKYIAVGLICEHSYSLITVKRTKAGHQLCKLRNPWGNDKEWNGKWHDEDPAWTPALMAECDMEPASDGTFWMEYSDVCKWFNTIAICYTYRTWDSIRVAGNFEKGGTDLCLRLDVQEDCRIFYGLSQKDSRGCQPGTPDAKLEGMNLWAIKPGKKGPVVVVNTSTAKRDVFQCQPAKKGDTIFVLAQPKEAGLSKSFVMSLMIEEGRSKCKCSFLTGKGTRYGSAKEVVIEDWKATEASYQIKGEFSTNAAVIRRQGREVKWEGAAQEALQHEQANLRRYVDGDQKKPDVPPEAKRLIEIEVGLIGGKGLAAMDDCGTSDPFCEVKLRATDKQGKVLGSHRCPQKRITAVQWKTLDPKWGENMRFLATTSDCIKVNCFDMDEVGKDSLGMVEIKIADLLKKGLKEGAAAVTADYKLEKEYPFDTPKGTLQISVKLIKG